MRTFPFEISVPENPAGAFSLTVRVKIPEDATASEVITYIRSHAMKQDLANGWIRQNAANHGLEVRGGPRPITEDPQNLSSKLLAYEQEFRLCPKV